MSVFLTSRVGPRLRHNGADRPSSLAPGEFHGAASHISLKFGAGRTIRCVRSYVLRELLR
jgi:hypothetical protein